jgi:hypothetical protein
MAGKLNVDDFITHRMPLADINKAFDVMHAGTRYAGLVSVRERRRRTDGRVSIRTVIDMGAEAE